MNVADASVWVSMFVVSDAHHAASRAWFAACAEERTAILAPAILLAEVAGAVARRTGRAADGDAAVRLTTAMPGLRLVSVDRHLATHGAALAAALRLRGADAFYVALADLLNVPLVTWDDEQVERARGRVTTARPRER